VGSLRDCTWILGLLDYRVVALQPKDDGRLVIDVERRGIQALCLLGLWTTGRPRPRCEGSHVGRRAVGGASGDVAILAAPALVVTVAFVPSAWVLPTCTRG
jgi:hypothetical protein